MRSYICRRILYALLVMWGVATLVFFMMRAIPGDPVKAMIGLDADPATIEQVRHNLGLDQPFYVQYGKWLKNLLQGDLGHSIYSQQQVGVLIAEAFPRTLSLALFSFLIALLLSLPAGLVSAVRKYSTLDHFLTLLAFLGLSMPNFWLGIILIIVFSVKLRWLPSFGYAELSTGFVPWLKHLLLPSIAIGTAFSAVLARMTRSAMLEVLSCDYMKTARSKGLPERIVLLKHALRNALIPVVTVMGIAFALLLSGAVIIEDVFAIKGLGRLLIRSILNRDYPVVQGTILVISGVFVFVNLFVDMLYTYINPMIRYEE